MKKAMKAMWKLKRSGLKNKIEKKMKLVVKKMKTKVNKEDGENNDEKIKEVFWNQFLKQSKKERRILWKKSHGF